eukprot:m.47669 g.47669  ORF g.47669 m.47669 type:complete len:118 (+) comp10523_c0_seq4:126-479(+)
MPYIRVETNVALSKSEATDLAVLLSKDVSELTGKPIKYVSGSVLQDIALVFGGTSDPCAQVYLGCIGVLGKEKNVEISARIATRLNEALKVPSDRYYIYFCEQERHEVGWNGATFAK